MPTTEKHSLLTRLADRILPQAPDFYDLLNQQCILVDQGSDALLAYMESGEVVHAERVRALEHQADEIKQRNLDKLHRAFATQMDREDIFRAINAIDMVLNYAKSTVREMALLELPPDEHTHAMARLLKEGTAAIAKGFAVLEHSPEQADTQADLARKTERRTEKIYRSALAELFNANHYLATLTPANREQAAALGALVDSLHPDTAPAVATSVAFIIEILKRREVYRHMSNAADRVATAGDVLHDIVVKVT